MPTDDRPILVSAGGIEPARRFSLRLFGGFDLVSFPGGERVLLPGKRERSLLAYLALSSNVCQPRQKLAALLWGDTSNEAALHNLRTCIWNLRKALGDGEHCVIASEGENIVLNSAAIEVDALEFRRLAAQPGVKELDAAANLYTGEFLIGLDVESEDFESWRRAGAMRTRDQAIDVLARLMDQLTECGEKERAIAAGVRLLAFEPLHETAARQMMRLYSDTGRRGAAVQLYRTLAEALRTELDAEPEPETALVLAEITRREDRTGGSDNGRIMPPPPSNRKELNETTLPAPFARQARLRVPAMLAAALVIAAGLLSYRHLVPGPDGTAASEQAAVATAPVASATQSAAISVAVLPFANLSGDATQEFFSDGLTEEITAALAKVPGLQLIARGSAFQFKNRKTDLLAAGQALGARYVIDGSVRKADNRLRITAQLVRIDSGVTVWSDSYDRELTDVFAIQENIARAIATSLRTPLGLKADQNLVNNRGIDTDSYGEFLRAKALVRIRDQGGDERRAFADATALLEPIVARYPNFAPAWAQLALIYQRMPIELRNANTPVEARRRASEQWLAKAEAASDRAIASDPTAPDGYSSLGLTMAMRGHLLRADELFAKALTLDPFYPEALHSYTNLLSGVGRHKEALATREKVASIEPFVPVYHSNLAELRWIDGQTEAVIGQLKTRRPQALLARIYAAMGHDTEAIDILRRIPPQTYPDGMLENAVRLMRTASTDELSPQRLPAMNAGLNFVYVHAAALERIMQPLEDSIAAGYLPPLGMSFVWQPSFAPLRGTERFKAFARDYGLVEYWRAKGWPAECRPRDGNDFECN